MHLGTHAYMCIVEECFCYYFSNHLIGKTLPQSIHTTSMLKCFSTLLVTKEITAPSRSLLINLLGLAHISSNPPAIEGIYFEPRINPALHFNRLAAHLDVGVPPLGPDV